MMGTEVFVFAGFLGSGKTKGLQGTLLRTSEIRDNSKSLIICTEEGEEEYDSEALRKIGIEIIYVENEFDLDEEFIEELDDKYSPERVYVEFNGMWDIKIFLGHMLPAGWYISTIFSFVDARTYENYLKNMRQTIMTPLSVSDVILINRCSEEFPRGDVRRAIKILNNKSEIFFTNMDGSVDFGLEEFELPGGGACTEIIDEVFCPWFVDCIEHTEKYYGKVFRFTGVVTSGMGLKPNQFYIGRYTVVCCPEDAQFIGFVAEFDEQIDSEDTENHISLIPQDGDWVQVEAELTKGYIDDNKNVIILKVLTITKVDAPIDTYLYY